MLRSFRLLAAACAVCVAFASSVASAQTPLEGGSPDGQVNAVKFDPVPAGAAITVRALDNSDTSLSLQAAFEKALAAAGYRIAPDSQLVFTFETRNAVGAWSDSGRRSILELEGHGGRMGGEDARAKLNLFNSSRGGLFNKGQGETNIVTQGRYRIDATLDDRGTRKRVWQGWAECELGRYTDQELLEAMVPFVAAAVGQTVRAKAFKLP